LIGGYLLQGCVGLGLTNQQGCSDEPFPVGPPLDFDGVSDARCAVAEDAGADQSCFPDPTLNP
jgi:hypothetical protein